MVTKRTQLFFVLMSVATLLKPYEMLAQSIRWEQTAGPLGGSVYSLAVDQNQRVFAGSYVTGVFRSTNSGGRWEHSTVPNRTVNAIIVNDSGHVFAGSGGVVYRSTDHGSSWDSLKNGLDGTIISALATGGGGAIFAGSSGSQSGVFRSTDNGESWVRVGLSDTAVVSLAVSASGWVYAGTYLVGLWSSTNGGNSWVQTPLTTSAWVTSIAPVGSSTVFAGLYSSRLSRTTNNGSSWSQIGPQGVTVNSLAVNSSNHVFAASADSGVYRSTNYGTTWTKAGLSGVYLTSITVDSAGRIYAGSISGGSIPGGSDGGVFLSTDDGVSWSKVGLPNTTIPALTTSGLGGSAGNVFASVDSVVFRTSNNGDSWQRTGSMPHSALSSFAVKSLFTSTSTFIFAGTLQSGIYRTMNEGGSWVQVGAENEAIYSFAENESGHLYASGSNAVYLSLDGGSNWAITPGVIPGNWLSTLAISPNGQVFVGMVNRLASTSVFSSTDEGQTWLPCGLISDPVKALLDDGNGLLFAGCASFFGNGGGVYRSTDSGATWTEASSGLSNKDIRSLVRNSLGHIFAGTGGGVFRTTDNGDTWEEQNTGLASPSIESLSLSFEGVLFAGTFTLGVFKTLASTTSVGETRGDLPQSYTLEQNFPNPFNSATVIKYQLATGSYVTLIVYDVLGREIATLVDGRQDAGPKWVGFDAAQLASGVYLYRLNTPQFTETRKLLLLR